MLSFLSAKNPEIIQHFLCKEVGLDFLTFLNSSNNKSETFVYPWDVWKIASIDNLKNYFSSGVDGIFGLEYLNNQSINQHLDNIVLIKGGESIDFDEKSLEFIKNISAQATQKVYFYLDSQILNANLRKLLKKHELNLIEIPEISTTEKSFVAKKYVGNNYPNHLKNLNSNTLSHLTKIDLCQSIIDMIDYLVLLEVGFWDEQLLVQSVNQTVTQAQIFQLNFSKNSNIKDFSILYQALQNPDLNQLLFTVLYNKMENKFGSNPDSKTWVSKLIQADYKSKTRSNAGLWAKLWLYDIINSVNSAII